jgi:tetratricopeptide (TPR) repeat protein
MRRQLKVTTVTAILGLAAAVAVAGPQARVSGVVVDSAGSPITAARITITSNELPSFVKEITTGDDGAFKVLLLDATKVYVFTVQATGYLEHAQEIKVAVGTTDNYFTFELATPEERAATKQQELKVQPGYKQLDEATELLAAGRDEEARARLVEAVAARPDLVEAYEVMADIDFDAGDNALALATARRCLELDGESLKCLAIASNAAGRLGDNEAQAGYLAIYQELNPDDPATAFNSAVVYLNKMDDDGARPLLEQCLEIDPDYSKCLFEYGMLLLRAGDLEGAKTQLDRYLEVAPDGPDATTAAETVKYL